MAVMETKIVQVSNSEHVINELSNDMACFGWTVTNVQITHSQNTKTYSSVWDQIGGNQSKTVETTTINYATVTLQRDRGIANYQKIVALEKEYEVIANRIASTRSEAERAGDFGCLSILFWPLAVYKIFFNKKEDRLNDEVRSLTAQKNRILEQAAALLG